MVVNKVDYVWVLSRLLLDLGTLQIGSGGKAKFSNFFSNDSTMANEPWLPKFEACRDANGWKVIEEHGVKGLKLPAFPHTASIFYIIPT